MDESDGPSVEGPAFVELVRKAEETTQALQANQWNFQAVPEFFAKNAACDVAAKEIVIIHDGQWQTRIGRLVMTGFGTTFNLMGPEPSRSVFKQADTDILDEVNRQIGSKGLYDFPDFHKLNIQQVDFHNFTIFYQLRDLVFWSSLYGGGLVPSGFERLAQFFVSGRIVENQLFIPSMPSSDPKQPVSMLAPCLDVQFPTPVVEWMDKPMYGGVVKETLHIQSLLTLEPTNISHPYLPLVGDGRVVYGHRRYYLRRFAGISPKEGLRGPDVSAESVGTPDKSSKGEATA